MIFGIGIDIIEIERIKKAILRSPRFLGQVYTEMEIADCAQKPNYFSSLAARFAAKEAVSKALGVTMWVEKWRQIEVGQIEDRPSVSLKESMAERASQLGVKTIHLSLSHDRERAVAFAVAEQ